MSHTLDFKIKVNVNIMKIAPLKLSSSPVLSWISLLFIRGACCIEKS